MPSGRAPSLLSPNAVFAQLFWKTLDNNNLSQVVASSGFSENKEFVGGGGGGGEGAKSHGLIKPGLCHCYLRIFNFSRFDFPTCYLGTILEPGTVQIILVKRQSG